MIRNDTSMIPNDTVVYSGFMNGHKDKYVDGLMYCEN